MALPVRKPEQGKEFGKYILYIIGFALVIFLISLIPPIKINSVVFGDFEWYLISPKIVFNIRFWWWVMVWIMIQFGIFYTYFKVGRWIKDKVFPILKRVEEIPSKVQEMLHER